MTLDQINFAPLEQSQNAWKIALRGVFKGKSLIIFILLMIVGLGSVFLAPPIIFIVLTIFFIRVAVVTNKIKTLAWRQFAAINGWQMDIQNVPMNLVPPSLVNSGHSQRCSEVVDAKFDNVDCDLMTYEFTIGSGKSSQTFYFTIADVVLPKTFPHIILDSNKNRGGFRNIPGGYENLKLEGDFDNYFKLYVVKGQEIDVLSIITPDVMQTLINADQQQDMEIYGNNLFFIGINDERSPAAMRTLLHSVSLLSAEILQRAQTLNYTPPAQA